MSELSIFIEHSDLNIKSKELNLANPSTLLQAEMWGGKACAHALFIEALPELFTSCNA